MEIRKSGFGFYGIKRVGKPGIHLVANFKTLNDVIEKNEKAIREIQDSTTYRDEAAKRKALVERVEKNKQTVGRVGQNCATVTVVLLKQVLSKLIDHLDDGDIPIDPRVQELDIAELNRLLIPVDDPSFTDKSETWKRTWIIINRSPSDVPGATFRMNKSLMCKVIEKTLAKLDLIVQLG